MDRRHQPMAIGVLGILFMVSAAFGIAHGQSDYYVDALYGNDGNDGLSWGSAKGTIAGALVLASGSDTLHVAEGTYTEQLSVLQSGLSLLGGYPSEGGVRDPESYESIIDGSGSGIPFTIETAVDILIDGFRITSGLGAAGGGMLCVDCTATIQNNVISENTCTGVQGGGGISVVNSDVDILSNVIEGNMTTAATAVGGGISIDASSTAEITGNEITGNLSHSTGGDSNYTAGGAVSNLGNLTATGNLFSGNEARSTYSGGYGGNLQKYAYGGGVYCGAGCLAVLSGNTFIGNLAYSNLVNTSSSYRAYSYAYGGALYCGANSDVTLTNETIESNTASGYGEDTSSNGRGYAWTYGGGIFCADYSVVSIGTGSRVTENYCAAEGNGSGSYDYAYTYGGGISLHGANASLEIDGVLVQDNTMSATPDQGSYGGGIYINSGNAYIVNCMVVENQDDGAYFTSGTVDFFHNTVAYNSGYGVYVNSGTANIKNCILWGHADDLEGAGLTYSNIQEGVPGEGNLYPPCDPMFVGFGNYHLRVNSCCIDRGTVVDSPDHDFDGEARPFGSGPPDMGADEASAANPTATPYFTPSGTYTPVPTPSADYYVDGDFGDDANDGLSWATAKATIQEALDAAEGAGGGAVHAAISIYYENIVIPDNIRLLGGYAHGGGVRNPESFITIIDGYGMDSAVKISGVSNVFIEGFVIRNGHGGYGGGIYVSHASGVEITGNKIRENECASQPALPNLALGGGLYLHGHDILIHDNLITENLAYGADGYGGGIYCAGGGSIRITNNLLTYNTAQVAGGGIFINHPGAPLLIDDNAIQWNLVDGSHGSGGAIYVSNGSSATVHENLITDNRTYRVNTAGNESRGGGIYCAGELILTENEIRRNEAFSYYNTGYGGNLYQYAYGGALFCADGSSVNTTMNTIEENVAHSHAQNTSGSQRGYGYSYGGAIYCDGGSTLVISAQPLVNNTAYAYGEDTASSGRGYAYAYGGGIHLADNSDVTLGLGFTVIENKSNAEANGSSSYDYAYSYGGGISMEGVNVQTLIDRLIIRGNETNSIPNYVRQGGGLYVNGTPVEIINNFIVENIGDGVYLNNTTLIFQHNTVADNSVYGLYVNGGSPAVKNCILWNNGDDLHGVTATYCDILDADPGEGNLDPPCDPLFVGNGDYHLMSNSCCIDRGSPYEVPTHDCDGEVRPYSFTFPDIGADETASSNPTPTPYATPSGTITPVPTPSNDYYVDGQTGDDANDGLSWATARKSINGAMQLAEASGGGNVHVVMWTYYERVICPNNVRVYGGYSHDDGIRNPTAYPTIIDGDGARIGIMISGVEKVFVDGFIIRNCKGGYGGGIYVNDSAHIYITNNIIKENHVSDAGSKSVSLGAGLYLNGHDVNILDNLITKNFAEGGTGYGGGIYCADGGSIYISGNSITFNTAGSVGGGIALNSPSWKLFVENNLFDSNTARSQGGALFIESMSSADVFNNTFLSNSAAATNSAGAQVMGGAIHCDGDLTVTGNAFTGNDANAYYNTSYGAYLYEYAYGGAISCGDGATVLTYDNVYQGNSAYAYAENTSGSQRGYAYSYGGAIYCAGGSHIAITSETIEDNTSFAYGIDNASNGRGYGYAYGGGLVCDDNAVVDFGLNVVITNNKAQAQGSGSSSASYAYGGGMAVLGPGAAVEFDRMIIQSNIATASPSNIEVGGVYVNQTPVTIYNTFIVDHTGDGLYLNNSDATVINNTIAYNFDYGIRVNGGSPTVKNCILWGNLYDLSGVSATYSNIQSGDPGEGNLDPPCDPLFISRDDYHIHPYSCCVDRGTYYDIPDHDFDGDARPFGAARPDMGADETTGANPTPSPYITPAGTPTAGPSPTPGADFYVDGLAGDDANDGLTWSTARASINSAMELVEGAGGGVIHVTGHIYNESIICASNLVLLAGYPHGGGPRNPEGFPTIIDPEGIDTAVIISNVSNVEIDGFIIRNGHGGLGGGFHVSRARNILINDNKIRDNFCNSIPGGRNVAHGAGLYLEGADITVTNNEITDNVVEPSTGYGGGIYCGPGQRFTIAYNNIGYNTSHLAGGGIALISVGSTVDIHDNVIEENRAGNSQAKGGGIYIDSNSSAVVTFNTITENSSYCSNNADSNSMGGGIYTESELLVTENDFLGNEAYNYYNTGYGGYLYNYSYGGAIYCGPGSSVVSYDNNYRDNVSYCYTENTSSSQRGFANSYGGVFYCAAGGELTLSNETYIENTAYSYGIDNASSGRGYGYSYGGAVAAGDESTVHIGSGIVIVNNYADANGSGSGSYDYAYAYGAGLAFLGSNASVDVQRVEIKENYGLASPNSASVGGVYIDDAPVEFFNNFVVDNSGDGMYLNTTNAEVINNTIAYNTARGIYANGGSPVIKNCILWGHTDDLVGGTASYCDIENGDEGEGNMDPPCHPVFMGNGDYHLHPGSCCIDRGTSIDIPSIDFDGDTRPYNYIADIGADETQIMNPTPDPSITPNTPTPTGSPTPTPAAEFYVDKYLGDDTDDGLSWGTAKASIRGALDAASSGGLIHITRGTYYEHLPLHDGITLMGGYPVGGGARDPETYVTILRGTVGGSPIMITNAENIALTGLTITGGNEGNGGGFFCYGGRHIQVYDCIFAANEAGGDGNLARGGAVYIASSYDVWIHDCLFINNTVTGTNDALGGAMYIFDSGLINIEDNTFQENTSPHAGGAVYCTNVDASVVFSRNIFRDNMVSNSAGSYTVYGGAIYCDAAASPLISANTFEENSAYTTGQSSYPKGGAVYSEGGSVIVDNVFEFNEARSYYSSGYGAYLYEYAYGGAIYTGETSSLTLESNHFTGNKAYVYANNSSSSQRALGYSYGGAVYCGPNSTTTIDHCTVIDNTAYAFAGEPGSSGRAYAYSYGGGIYIDTGAAVVIHEQTAVRNNKAHSYADASYRDYGYSYGGGIYIYEGVSSVQLDRIMIDGNDSISEPDNTSVGDGLYFQDDDAISITNCFLTSNGGYGMYSATAGTNIEFIHNTVGGNGSYGIYVNSGTLDILNCVIWDNGDDLYGVSAEYCNIEDGDAGLGNISADPVFVGAGDYHITETSPCINTALTLAGPSLIEVDYDANDRPQEEDFDMGADEYAGLPEFNLTVLLDGYYAGGSQPATTVDLEFRSGSSPQTADTVMAVMEDVPIDSSGQTGDIDLVGIPGGDLYLVINHLNHLDVITSERISVNYLTKTTVNLADDTADDYAACYGSDPQQEEPDGMYSLRGGNANGDGYVNAAGDFVVWLAANGSSQGGPGWDARADFNGDTVVNSSDYSVWLNQNGRITYVPEASTKNDLLGNFKSGRLELRYSEHSESDDAFYIVMELLCTTESIAELIAVDAAVVYDPIFLGMPELTADYLRHGTTDVSLGLEAPDWKNGYHYSRIALPDQSGVKLQPGENILLKLKFPVRLHMMHSLPEDHMPVGLAPGFSSVFFREEFKNDSIIDAEGSDWSEKKKAFKENLNSGKTHNGLSN